MIERFQISIKFAGLFGPCYLVVPGLAALGASIREIRWLAWICMTIASRTAPTAAEALIVNSLAIVNRAVTGFLRRRGKTQPVGVYSTGKAD